MRKVYLRLAVVCVFILLSVGLSFAGTTKSWIQKFEPQKVFIENKGQFKINESEAIGPEVLYAYNGQVQNYYFTRSGVVFELVDVKKLGKNEEDNEKEQAGEGKQEGKENEITAEERERLERSERRLIISKEQLSAIWMGANPNVQVVAEGQSEAYYSYSFKDDNGKLVNENNIPAYAKLTYKNLYPNIDVVYELHPKGGIKYSVLVHPGGDVSQLKLQYSENAKLLPDGDIVTGTRFGDFIDHAPSTFYEGSKAPVTSSYLLSHDVISFSIGSYDHSQTIVIDPWTETPNFAGSGGWQCVWECQKDAAGNVYAIGGVSPMQEVKYNPAGVLQWTYSTPWDTSTYWLGTFAVDNAGNSYVTAGSAASIVKVNTTGGVVWSNLNPGGIFTLTEFWCISFNCDQTQLVIGGTSGTLYPQPEIYNMDMSTGNVSNSAQITTGSLLPPFQEVRAITSCPNGNYYFLTHDSIGYIHQGLTSCLPPGSSFPFHVSNSYNLAYKCEDFRVDNTGIKAITSFGGYVYTHRGNQVHKRLFNTAAIIATGTIPGGAYTNSGGEYYVSNSGIAVDSCGNVYAGSTDEVVEYNSNLVQIATFPTSFNVYDVQVAPGGTVIAAGSTGNYNSGARTGYVETFAAGACSVVAVTCCDASICPVGPVCVTAAPFNLSSTTSGGVWSGTGITNAANGTFSPSVSGIGTFTVYYTLACGRDSTTISVVNCSALTVCRNANGSVTVSGGSAPYTWSVWDSTGEVCQGGIVLFGICTGTWVPTYGWTVSGSGTTFTPPSQSDTILVSDAGAGDSIYNISALPTCTSCNLAIQSITSANPGCTGNTGTATVNLTTGTGTAPFHYHWSNADTTQAITGLGSGTYSVTVTDAGGCTATATVTLTATGALTLSPGSTAASCGNSNGSATVTATGGTTYTYLWSDSATTQTINNIPSGTYTVTVTSGSCTAVTSLNVASTNGVSATLGSQVNVKCFGESTGSAIISATGGTTPYTYTWSASGSTVDSATGLAAGNYSVTVKDANNCSSLVSFTITQPSSGVAASDTMRPSYCGNSDGKIYVTASGGTPGYTYTWSPAVSTADSAIDLAAGSYQVTVTDANHCTVGLTAVVQPAAGETISLQSQQNVTCYGGSNGKIYVTSSGGTGPYTYTWSPAVSGTDSAVNLTQGTYDVTAHDANGCTSSLSVSITQPAPIGISTTTVPANCGVSNGSATAIVTGGISPLTFQWSVGSSITAVDSGLAAGAYTVTVTDANHCTAIGNAAISNIGGPTATISSQINEACNGQSIGKAVLDVTGGTQPYTYIWSPNASTTDSAVNLAAGTYDVTVHDASSCIAVVNITITQPQAIAANTQSANTTCGQTTGWASIHVTGGTAPYIFVWSVPQSADSITDLAGGTYYVTVTDSAGCQFSDSVVIGTDNGPAAPSISAGGPLTFCQGGSVVLTSSAPAGNIWSNAATTQSITVTSPGTYTVTQTVGACTSPPSAPVVVTVNPVPPAPTISASGPTSFCQGGSVTLTSSAVSGNLWSNNQTTQSITVSAAGSYTVSDTLVGCPSPASAPVTVSILPSPQPVIAASQPSLCPGSSITLNATTASATAYIWNTTSTQPEITVDSAGVYAVTVTAGGCEGSDTITISAEPLPGPLTLPDTISTCAGDSVTLNATTASATTYAWSGEGVTATTPIITVDSEGVYYVTVSNDCGSVTGFTTITFKDCECRIVMPNAFTPNGDGKNDYFGPNFDCPNAKSLSMSIFDRWGEKVYETDDLNGQWDGRYKGTMQPPGIYVYYVNFVGMENNAEKSFKLMGSLTLIR